MESVLDFIRDFDLTSHGLDAWDILFITGSATLGFILLKWIVSWITPTKALSINKILDYTFYLLVYSVWGFIIVKAILKDEYGSGIIICFILLLPFLRKWISNFYKRYDSWVDRVVDRK